jgi:hypothetical protein
MIFEVDAALEALLRRDALNGSRVDVLFDAPTKDWVARRNAPTIDIYLYDIREDLPRRQIVMEPVRDASTGYVTERRMPARRFRLSYMLTCWTQRPEDEHRLLAACLSTFVRNEFIPRDLTAGSLAESPYPVLLNVCLPTPPERSIADVWSALGGELKPSLDLIAIAPLDPAWSEGAAAAVLEEPTIGVGGPGIAAEGLRRGTRGGRGRHGRGGPLGPGDQAIQAELIGGSSIGIRGLAGRPAAEAAHPGPGRRRKGAAAEGGGEAVEGGGEAGEGGAGEARGTPDAAALGPGRIVRVRGISRP